MHKIPRSDVLTRSTRRSPNQKAPTPRSMNQQGLLDQGVPRPHLAVLLLDPQRQIEGL